MLNSLKIENYRGFQSFELQQLGRINLLVGENNSGKTSVLEAIQLLYSRANLEPLNQIMVSRGELFWNDDRRINPRSRNYELDICHLFHGHELSLESRFSITGNAGELQNNVTAFIDLPAKQGDLFDSTAEGDELGDLSFAISWNNKDGGDLSLPLSSNGGLIEDSNYARRMRRLLKISTVKTLLVSSSALTPKEMLDLFYQVVLNPEEEIVVHALQAIDPAIERIASVGSGFQSGTRGGFAVRRSGDEYRVPIGSMGDGIWRMLGLALAAACTKGGILLVDEIDTGLHFTAMSKMWKMIWETAKQSNVQVFATTHSRDCWESLAELADSEEIAEGEITIQRIEPGKSAGIVFNERQMVIAAEHGIEVR